MTCKGWHVQVHKYGLASVAKLGALVFLCVSCRLNLLLMCMRRTNVVGQSVSWQRSVILFLSGSMFPFVVQWWIRETKRNMPARLPSSWNRPRPGVSDESKGETSHCLWLLRTLLTHIRTGRHALLAKGCRLFGLTFKIHGCLPLSTLWRQVLSYRCPDWNGKENAYCCCSNWHHGLRVLFKSWSLARQDFLPLAFWTLNL